MENLYTPWFCGSEYIPDEEEKEQDDWISYLSHSFPHTTQSPFPESEWSYEKKTPFTNSETCDEAIQAKVVKALYLSEKIDASKIIVAVINGTVHLFGSVYDQIGHSLAAQISKTIPGVWRVENHLLIDNEVKS